MNNARRRESGHSRDGDRWYPFISMPYPLSRPVPVDGRPGEVKTPGIGIGSTSLLAAREAVSSIRLHYERLSHSAAHISLPTSRRNVCRDADQIALSISDACSALPLVPSLPSVPRSIVALPPPRSGTAADLMELSARPRQHVPLIFHSRVYQLLSGVMLHCPGRRC